MRKTLVVSAMLLFGAAFPFQMKAGTFGFNFNGPGVSGAITLTYGPATDMNYPGKAFEVTGISGLFSDINNGLNLVNVPIGPLEPLKYDTPESGNTAAPHDFSRFAVATGLGPQNNGFLTYDNLFWPAGSPETATGYTPHGGFLDIYGLMFDIGGGKVVNFWSNGDPNGSGKGPIYGVAVATHDNALDYTGGVTVTPEPGALTLFGSGLIAIVAWRRRALSGRS